MITLLKMNNTSYWTRLMVFPLSLILFCAIALYGQKPEQTTIQQQKRETIFEAQPESNFSKKNLQNVFKAHPESITILVDAGHGGKDSGARSSNGLLEKDLALAIAKEINQHAAGYNIKVIMTRNNDDYPPIKQRTEIAEAGKVDMIVSIHLAVEPTLKTNASSFQDTYNGFEVFITSRNEKTMESSREIGVSILQKLGIVYTTHSTIKQRKEEGIWILDKAYCPAVMIQCGYITNDKDVDFFSKPENQEKPLKGF